MKTLGIVLVIAGIVGLLIGGGIFLFITKTVPINTMPITIEKATYYSGQTSAGFWGPKEAYYSQLQVAPTPMAKANIRYLITTDNGLTKQTYSVSWSQAEIAISKVQTIADRISQDAYTALQQKSQYTVNISEKVAQHDVIFIIPGILFFVLGAFLYVMSVVKERDPLGKGVYVTKENNQKEQPTKPIPKPNKPSCPTPEVFYQSPDGQGDGTPPPGIRTKKIEQERKMKVEELTAIVKRELEKVSIFESSGDSTFEIYFPDKTKEFLYEKLQITSFKKIENSWHVTARLSNHRDWRDIRMVINDETGEMTEMTTGGIY